MRKAYRKMFKYQVLSKNGIFQKNKNIFASLLDQHLDMGYPDAQRPIDICQKHLCRLLATDLK